MTASQLTLLAVAAFLAGSVNTVAGGGSLLSFPALLAVGLPPVAANVTNTVAVWPGYIGGVAAYRRELTGQRQRAVVLSAVSVTGAVVGSALLLLAPARAFQLSAPYLILVGCFLLAVQPRISRWLQARRPAAAESAATSGPTAGIAAATTSQSGSLQVETKFSLGLLTSAFGASVYGAYFGAGLGIVLLALLALFIPDSLQRHNGQKVLLSLVINTVALVVFVLFGPVRWGAVAVMVLASLAGGYVGGGVARRLPATLLRGGVIVFGIAVASVLAVRG